MDEKELAVINVIPFIDIMLVLLTIVLTTSTFIARGAVPVQLPRASSSPPAPMRTQIIEIDRRGAVFCNATPVECAELGGFLSGLNRATPMLIRADRETALQAFVDVMDVLKNLGFNKVGLQTERKNERTSPGA